MRHDVIGQYKCSCSYGPVPRRKRLAYCPEHGAGIRDEYVVPHKKVAAQSKPTDAGKEKECVNG